MYNVYIIYMMYSLMQIVLLIAQPQLSTEIKLTQ